MWWGQGSDKSRSACGEGGVMLASLQSWRRRPRRAIGTGGGASFHWARERCALCAAHFRRSRSRWRRPPPRPSSRAGLPASARRRRRPLDRGSRRWRACGPRGTRGTPAPRPAERADAGRGRRGTEPSPPPQLLPPALGPPLRVGEPGALYKCCIIHIRLGLPQFLLALPVPATGERASGRVGGTALQPALPARPARRAL